MTTKPTSNTSAAARFGTFGGVFVPNVLTILGIILFLRIGWVVGYAGLWGALAIVALANLISLLTGLSLSAVATAMDVRAGGNYYLISRSLGLEIGGAIGIPLFLSQAISVAFYIIGFTEASQNIPFFAAIDPRIISTAIALLFMVIAFIGADFALKIQYFILAILIAAILSFFAGGWDSFTPPLTESSYADGVTFWIVFAVFFPAVTGIEVGTSLSGDLKDPSRSIPLGTIASILITAVIYMLVVLWFAFHTVDPLVLINDGLAMQRIALFPVLILAGVWASTLSSALGSVLAAPRTLQAIAKDRVAPRWMASQLGSKTEPRVAVLLTGAIALGVIWLGDLNAVAPIISMFFLNTYGMVNLSAGIEKLVGNPSFRPRFNIPWYISILGAIGCYAVMFLINPTATFIAIVISYGVYFFLQRQRLNRTWGDVRTGIWLALARHALLQLEGQKLDAKNWRPNIMVFTGQPHNRQQLVTMANWLTLGHGIVTFFQLIVGDIRKLHNRGLRETARRSIHDYIVKNKMSAFAEAEIVSSFKTGLLSIAQAHGIGELESNAVLMGWSRSADGRTMQMALTRELFTLQKSILFLNVNDEKGFGQRRKIHVWWQGRGANANLMLVLAYIIRQHPTWREAEIRILRIVGAAEAVPTTKAHLQGEISAARVKAEPVILVNPDKRPITSIISEESHEADLTLIGMQLPSEADETSYGERLNALVNSIGTVLIVRNAEEDVDLLGG
ncbi:MAG: hypothetical protein QNJ45_16915 [Ardenticatenaceae bacterium]|nr:hypothetical protein [Ardenticatenaceae bacterium]